MLGSVLTIGLAAPARADWSGWDQLGSGVTTAHDAPSAVISAKGDEDVFVTGTDGWLHEMGRAPGGTWPTAWSKVGPPSLPVGQTLIHAPSALKISSTQTDVFATMTPSNNVYVTTHTTGGTWSSWVPLGASTDTTPFAPEGVMTASGGILVLIIGPSNKLWTIDGTAGGGWAPRFTERITAGGQLTSAPAAQWAGGVLDVFARGTNGWIYKTSQTSGTWGTWSPISSDVTAYGPAVVVSGSGNEDVFFTGTGTDYSEHEISRHVGGTWNPSRALTEIGGAIFSAPAALALTNNPPVDTTTVDLFGTGGAQHIYAATYVASAPASLGSSISALANSQSGYQESGGPSCNKYTAYFGRGTATCGSTGNRAEDWCADFAEWVWQQAGVDVTGLNALALSFKDYGVAHGTWHTSNPQPGDAAVYDGYEPDGHETEHVGIVVSVTNGLPDVVNGNFSGAVVELSQQVSNDPQNIAYDLVGFSTPVPS
jgi:hypothetical protein